VASEAPTILVVEDEPAMQDLVRHVLERDGYRVRTAADGATGLDQLDADVDLVLLDIMLPGLSGLEFCRRVRAAERDDHLPIIMVTGLGSSAQRHAGFAAGADDYLVKPFDLQELLDRVQVWLQAGRRMRAGRRAARPPAPQPVPSVRDALLQYEGLLHYLVEEAARRPGFLAAALLPYARAQGWNDEDLAAALGCPRATLARLLLRPRPLPPTWDTDVAAIAEACGADATLLAGVLRAVEAWERARDEPE
jgi:CheY-like chemotaxis protein